MTIPFTVTIFDPVSNDPVIEFSDPMVYLSTQLIVPVGGSVTYNLRVIIDGGEMFPNEYVLTVVPGTMGSNYTENISILIANGEITFTGLSRGDAFFRLQLFFGGEPRVTTYDIDIFVD